jgi:hypothetical protein
VTVRVGPRVRRERFAAPGPALDALEARVEELAAGTHRGPARGLGRDYAPVELVAARAELRGPGRLLAQVRGGADVRGDGSVEAWTGWLRRRLVEPRPGEQPVQALRRELAEGRSGR